MNRRDFLAVSPFVIGAGTFFPTLPALVEAQSFAATSLIIFSEDFRTVIESSEFGVSSASGAYSIEDDAIKFGREHLDLIKQHATAVIGVTTWLDYLLLQGLFREYEIATRIERPLQLFSRLDRHRDAHMWTLA